MVSSILLSFLAGLFGANAVPHFVKGITKESYPCVFGNSPVPNFVAGWAGLIIAALLVCFADGTHYGVASLLSGAVGVLLIGLFHAKIGAFGK